MNTSIDISMIHFDEKGLVPAIVQEENGEVLMLAYMNEESLKKTLETGFTWFYSRSRKKLWRKGETSGNVQQVKEISYDCDGDTLLVRVHQSGVACHTGTYSCFSGRRLARMRRASPSSAMSRRLRSQKCSMPFITSSRSGAFILSKVPTRIISSTRDRTRS